MNNNERPQLRDPAMMPTYEVLEQILKNSYTAYETLQNNLPGLEIEQEWQWYTPHKVWYAKGQHFLKTPRGAKKVKNLYWLYVFDGYFSVAVWFKEKNRQEVLNAGVSEDTKRLAHNAETMGKLPTFPVVFDITGPELPTDIYTLLSCKKKLE